MQERQQELLKIIIKEYVKTAEPISSSWLVEKYKLPYSSATVRNEMAVLEDNNYIYQPHTSAGRVPTVKAYHFYINNFSSAKQPGAKDAKDFNKVNSGEQASLKQAAKNLADIVGLAVFWAFNRNDLYYTGISNLLSQPEFAPAHNIIDISHVIDQMEDIIDTLYSQTTTEPRILIGDDNPFGSFCGAVITKYQHNSEYGMFGIIGPARMDYDRCLGLVEYIKNNLK